MALADVQQIIDAAQSAASDALDEAKTYAQSAQSAASTVVSPGSSGTIVWVKPELVQPIQADSDLGNVFTVEAANAFTDLGPDWLDKFGDFLTTYFPDVNGCIRDNSDNWICDTIANGGTGIPAAIQDAIWQRAREAIARDIAGQRDGALTEFAARGFSLPSGALNYRLLQLDQTAIDKSAEVARETAIKNIEIEIENIKFAVQQAVQMRIGAAQAAIGYVGSYIKTYDSATDRAKAMTDARYKFWAASNSYYDAFARIEALDVQVKTKNVEHTLEDNKLFVQAAAAGTEIKVKAALAAAQSMGSAAAAALGAQNTLANVGDITNN